MDNLIRLASVTEAMKSKEILQRHNIKSVIKRIPPTNERYSCGYGLYIPYKVYEAIDILGKYGISPVGHTVGD